MLDLHDILLLAGLGIFFIGYYGLRKQIPNERKRRVIVGVPALICFVAALLLSLRALPCGYGILLVGGFALFFLIYYGLKKQMPNPRKRIVVAMVAGLICSVVAILLSMRALLYSPSDPFAEMDATVKKALKQVEDAKKQLKDLGFEVEEPKDVKYEFEYPPVVNGHLEGVERTYRVSPGQRVLMEEVPYVKGKREGIATSRVYDNNSELQFTSETPYVAGERHGVEKTYCHSEGVKSLYRETPYVHGRIDGVVRVYSMSTGRLTDEVPYAKGRREGECRQFDENTGSLVATFPFVNGEQHGIARWYFPSGRLSYEQVHNRGKQEKGTWWDEKGEVIAEEKYRQGKRWEGTFRVEDVEMSPQDPGFKHVGWSVTTFKGGKEDGKSSSWDMNGNLVAEGVYRGGKMWDGTFRVEEWPTEDSNVYVVKTFKNGREVR